MRLGVVGATGRMGRAVVRLAHGLRWEVVCAVADSDAGRDAGELAGVGPIGTPVMSTPAALEGARADVVIDFSAPAVTAALVPVAAGVGAAVVSGTTGLDDTARAALEAGAARIPLLWAPNMSVGVAVLARLAAQAAASLPAWDVEIVETHHGAKVDAPSGTALRLVEAIQHTRDAAARVTHGRGGGQRQPGPRPHGEIGVHAVRGGDVVGDHVVHFLGQGERIELTHRATNRDVFARGAIRAAEWIVSRPPGLYALDDVLAGRS